MKEFRAELRSVAAGSLPHTDPAAACQLMASSLDIAAWPQLPRRSFHENMYCQFSERFPGVVVADERISLDRNLDLETELEQLYLAYLTDDLEHGSISPDYAAGLHCFLENGVGQFPIVKGHVTGPVSWSLTVTDEDRKPLLYDEVLAEAVSKHLRLKAAWMERSLGALSPQTIMYLDEPYMSCFGSAFVSLGREQVLSMLDEVLAGINGLTGIHCCGNTDWSVLLATTVDILNVDAYAFAESLALFPEEVGAFLDRGGIIAWGIVPASAQALEETVDSLAERFLQAVGLLVSKGLHQDDILASALVMPSCGCGSLTMEMAERVLQLTGRLSTALQERYA